MGSELGGIGLGFHPADEGDHRKAYEAFRKAGGGKVCLFLSDEGRLRKCGRNVGPWVYTVGRGCQFRNNML